MPTNKQKLIYLLTKDHWTGEDKEWIAEQLLSGDDAEYMQLMLQLFNADLAEGSNIDYNLSRRIRKSIGERLSLSPAIPVRPIYAFGRGATWAASVAMLIIIAGVYFFYKQTPAQQFAKTNPEPEQIQIQHDVAPGGEKAILTLSDGSEIILDSASNGQLARQGNTQIVKLADGQLQYNADGVVSDKPLYNTMRTPRGGQYRLTLPDGTQVWLNAESSITYPASFAGKERAVNVTGEAYFEVAKIMDSRTFRPFKAIVNGMEVEVLGTHFNINSYSNESNIKTTLLEGSVKVRQGGLSGMLKPGEQSQVNKQGQLTIVKDANLEETMAWKNGLFHFVEADVQTVMRQVMRWYDVEVIYEGKIPVREFQGEIQKDLNLSQVLDILRKMEVNFRLEGRKLIVTQ